MEAALDRHVSHTLSSDATAVNRERTKVREACVRAAELEAGLFSLTVPTGGGKTLSSLAFALRHARLKRLDRVVYVIPFTSIIEQNADVFRQVMAPLLDDGIPDPVLEHHCAVDSEAETFESRLAAENWDAPLVVTTSVQFYESLFAHRTSRCRKLHNLARSVIILDEVQKLPVDYLQPCLCALRELTSHYGSSVVLCTATQPALCHQPNFPIGLEGIREIIPERRSLYAALKRVEIQNLGRTSDAELVTRLSEEFQALCVVNTRKHAREVFENLSSKNGVFHLSAAMCPQHRTKVLNEIRRLLREGEECRVISTQLVEAGVDVDFPVVYRSLAGLDSIAQAAGRCNRNGRLARGTTYLFQSEHGSREAFLRDTVNATVQLVGEGGVAPLYDDLLSLEAVEHFFRLYFWDQKARWDAHAIMDQFTLVNDEEMPFLFGFRSVGEQFRLIQDTGRPVIVPWGDEGNRLCEELRRRTIGLADLLRKLQRFTVQVQQRLWNREIRRSIELVHDAYPVLISPELHYHPELGLALEDTQIGPESLIV
jgi:CRISPR-associated endonuclease/helicase Cas3